MKNPIEHGPSAIEFITAKGAADLLGHASEFVSWQSILMYLTIFLLAALCRLAFLEWFSRKSPSVRRDLLQIFRSSRTRRTRTSPRKRRPKPRN